MAPAKAKAAAPKLRVATFQKFDESGFRLITPFGNRDFDGGILSTDENDPAYDWLLEWGKSRADIKVTERGIVVKSAVSVCPTCGASVDGEAALEIHNEIEHVEPESKGESVDGPVAKRG